MKFKLHKSLILVLMIGFMSIILSSCGPSTSTKWTVSFNSCGGSPVASIEVEDNALITQPQDPTKTGYSFVAWYKEMSYENEFNFQVEKITEDIILYAKWETQKINVSVNNGIDDVYTQEIAYGAKFSKPEHPTRDGYDFINWYADSSFSQIFDFNQILTQDVNIYAKWEAYFTLNTEGNGITGVTAYASNFQEIEIPDSIDGKKITLVCQNAFKDIDVAKFTFGKNIEQFEATSFDGAQIDEVYFKGYLSDWVKINFSLNNGTPLFRNLRNNVVTNLYIQHRLATGEDEFRMVSGTLEIYPEITEFDNNCFYGFYFINRVEYKNISLSNYLRINFASYYSNPMACATNILIGNDSLWGTVNIPQGTTKIPDFAFLRCPSMTSVVLPSTVKGIGHSAFDECMDLQSINLENVTTIGDEAFDECQNLENVTLTSCQTIGDRAFFACGSLQNLMLGNNLVSIGQQAFQNCINLVTLNLGTSVKSIGEYAFARSPKINAVNIPNSVTIIGRGAFSECKAIESVVIGSGLKEIPERCFWNSVGISTINLGNVEKIGEGAFQTSTRLISIVLPATLKEIDNEAFKDCISLATVDTSHISNLDYVGEDAFAGTAWLKASETIYLKNWLIKYDKTSTSVSINPGTTNIATGAFNSCTNLTSITIDRDVTVSGGAFKGCTALTDITIHNAATYVKLHTTGLLQYATTIKVDKDIVENNKTYVWDVPFTKTLQGNYYIFTRVQ